MNVITSVSRSVDFFFNASSCFCVSSNLTLLSFIFFSSVLADSNSLLTFASSSWLFFESALLAVSCRYVNSSYKFKINSPRRPAIRLPVFFFLRKRQTKVFTADEFNHSMSHIWPFVDYDLLSSLRNRHAEPRVVNYRSMQQNSMYSFKQQRH